MQSSYKRLGDYIQVIKDKNVNLRATKLLGINIDKFFMPSVANIVGTDLSNYKIVKKNQFACNRMHVGRDYRIPIALSNDENEFIVSPAYDVFEIIDTNVLLPEYLMMWFRRKEFDRNTWFHTDADVRGGLPWEAFSNLKLPIPSLEKQQEMVNEYHTIQNRINLNNQLIAKLEETAQTIYKQWFVDFEFPFDFAQGKPSENGKPYKSNGGKMVWCEELEKEIPEGWEIFKLEEFVNSTLGGDWGKEYSEGTYSSKVICIRGADIPNFKKGNYQNAPVRYIINKNLDSKKIDKNQIIIEISGGSPTQSTGRVALVTLHHLKNITYPLISSNFCRVIKLNQEIYSFYFFCYLEYLYSIDYLFSYENSTTGVKNFDLTAFLSEEYLLKPELKFIIKFNNYFDGIQSNIVIIEKENQKLEELKELLLVRMTRVEN